MAFVRVKRISGNEYAYLVENSWTDRGPRQRVGKYLGRVYRFEKAKSEGLKALLGVEDPGEHIRENDFKTVAADLVRLELHNHDVKANEFLIDFENLLVKKIRSNSDGSSGKNAVIAMNQGFLCSHTLKRLLEYDAGKDYSGYLLADVITAAGIALGQDIFVELYGKFRAKHEAAATKKFEFYY